MPLAGVSDFGGCRAADSFEPHGRPLAATVVEPVWGASLLRLTQTEPDGIRALVQVGGLPFDLAGCRPIGLSRSTCVRIGIFRWRELLARPRIPVTAPLPSGKLSFRTICDTCCLDTYPARASCHLP